MSTSNQSRDAEQAQDDADFGVPVDGGNYQFADERGHVT